MPRRWATGSGRATALTISVLLVAAIGGCGTDDNTTTDSKVGPVAPVEDCAPGTLSGAGATFVNTIMQQWIKEFAAACPGATINYQSVGSGAGVQQFTEGTVDFAGSDVALKDDEQAAAEAKHGPVLHLPWSAGGIAVEYNLTGVTGLQLSPATLAGIFAGNITKWNHASIRADNPRTTLPARQIQVVHRSDGSGTTAAFTAYLTAAAGSVWTHGAAKDVDWPAGQGAKGSDGVTAAVKQAEGSIGYAEVSYAEGARLHVARIKNAGGAFVGPTSAAVSAALAGAKTPDDLKVEVNYLPADPAAYPISTVTFAIVPLRPANAARARLLKSFLGFVLDAGQRSAEGLDYAPVPDTLARRGQAAVDRIAA